MDRTHTSKVKGWHIKGNRHSRYEAKRFGKMKVKIEERHLVATNMKHHAYDRWNEKTKISPKKGGKCY